MPISLHEAKRGTATVDVYREVKHTGFKSGDLNVEYFIVTDLTLEEENELEKALNGDTELANDRYLELFFKVVRAWDMIDRPIDEGGTMVPLTREGIQEYRVPSEMVRDIMVAIGRHKRPGERAGRR